MLEVKMIEIFNNKTAFQATKPKNLTLILILIFISFSILIIYLTQTKIYDNYSTQGIVTCNDTCYITTYIPSTITFDYLTINNKKTSYQIIDSQIIIPEDSFESLKKLSITTNNNYEANEILNLNFYYNKQRIITKMLNKAF